MAFLFTISPLFARFVRNGPNGVFRWKTTWCAFTTSMRPIASYSGAYPLAVFGARIRSNVYLTSWAPNFSPLWKSTFGFRSNTHVFGFCWCQLFASTT